MYQRVLRCENVVFEYANEYEYLKIRCVLNTRCCQCEHQNVIDILIHLQQQQQMQKVK